jgi:hypothetical protein
VQILQSQLCFELWTLQPSMLSKLSPAAAGGWLQSLHKCMNWMPAGALIACLCRCLFMASGMAVASFTQSTAAAGIAAVAAPLTWPADDMANAGALLVAVAMLAMLGLASVGQQVRLQHMVNMSL